MILGANAGDALCQALQALNLMDAEPEEALRLAKLSADQDDHMGCYACGCIMEKQGDYKQALEYYQKAVALGDRAAEPDVERMTAKLND